LVGVVWANADTPKLNAAVKNIAAEICFIKNYPLKIAEKLRLKALRSNNF
jgi:hypothetical protein